MVGHSERDMAVVGRITRPHGIRGEVCVLSESDNPDRFVPSATFHTNHAEVRLLVLRTARPGPNGLIAEFAGITSLDGASRLVGTELLIRAAERRELEPGEFWPDDLVGLQVRVGSETIGIVDDVVLGPQDRLVVAHRDGSTAEVPFVEALVPEVDPARGWVRIEPPEGLFSPPRTPTPPLPAGHRRAAGSHRRTG